MTGRARLISTAACLLVACGDSSRTVSRPVSRPKTVVERSDSALAVERAKRALGDTLQLRVDSFTRGSEGWLVRLLPQKGGTAGGGEVWVEHDSSATVVKRY